MALRSRGLQMIDQALADMRAGRLASDQNQQTANDRYLTRLMATLPPSQQQAAWLANPNWQKTGTFTVPDYRPTPDDELHGIAVHSAIDNYKRLPQAALQQAAIRLGTGADASADTIKLLNAQDVTGNPQNWTPEVQQRQAIEDKRSMDANQQEIANQVDRQFNQIDLPTSSANIGHMKAMTVEQLAAAGNQRAQTGKNIAETGKIGAETKRLSSPTLGAGGAPGAPAVPLAQAPAVVQMLVKRTYDPMLMRRFKVDEQNAILDQARQYDESLNLQDYPRMYAVAKSFTSGRDSQNKKSLNTAIGHLHDLWRASSEIDNFDSIPLLNTTANALKNRAALGSGKGKGVIDWNAAATGVSGELAALYKGGVGTDAEIKDWRAAANPNYSDEQRKAVVQQLAHMVGARFDALGSNYEQTGRPRTELLDAQAAKKLRDMGIDPSTFEVTGDGAASRKKTVTRAELAKMGSTPEEAAANGYEVVP